MGVKHGRGAEGHQAIGYPGGVCRGGDCRGVPGGGQKLIAAEDAVDPHGLCAAPGAGFPGISEREFPAFSTHAAEAFHHVAHASGAAHGFHHVLHFSGASHHLAHLAELLDELVDLHDRGAGTGGDALAARGLDDLRAGALVGRHGKDDGLGALELAVVEGTGGELFLDLAEARHQAEQALERPHFLDHAHLVEEVVEIEFALLHPLHRAHGVLLVDRLGDVLDHADNVAHAEDAVGHARGVELHELVEFLALAGVFDRLAGDLAHGQRRAAAGVAVELREHDAGDAHRVVEMGCDRNRLLAGGGVGDEEGFLGF